MWVSSALRNCMVWQGFIIVKKLWHKKPTSCKVELRGFLWGGKREERSKLWNYSRWVRWIYDSSSFLLNDEFVKIFHNKTVLFSLRIKGFSWVDFFPLIILIPGFVIWIFPKKNWLPFVIKKRNQKVLNQKPTFMIFDMNMSYGMTGGRGTEKCLFYISVSRNFVALDDFSELENFRFCKNGSKIVKIGTIFMII